MVLIAFVRQFAAGQRVGVDIGRSRDCEYAGPSEPFEGLAALRW